MKRWGSGERFLGDDRRASAPQEPDAAFRSSFIVGFPGETEREHDAAARRSSPPRSSTGPGSSRSRAEDGTPRRRSHGAVPTPTSSASGCASAKRCRSRSRGPRATRSSARRSRCSSTASTTSRRAGRPHVPRGARDRRRRAPRTPTSAPARARSCAATSPSAIGPDLVAKAACASDACERDAMSDAAAARVRALSAPSAIATPGELRHRSRGCCSRSRRCCSSSTDGLDVAHRRRSGSCSRATDGLDGWLARRDGATRSGAFLDPLADKVLVLGGFFALGITRRLLVVPGGHRRRARGRHLGVPVVRRRGGASRCRRASSASGRRSSSSSRSASCCSRRRTTWATFHDIVLWVAVALTVVSGLDIVHPLPACRQRRARERRRVGRCGVTSSRSAPSCCSARSSTRTAPGSASSSPRRASTRASTARSATTSAAWSRACASCSTGPTRSIVCGGLGPTPDDVTREAIAEVMGVELERREELIEHIRGSSAAAAATCPRTTCARPTCPMGGDVDPEPDRHRARVCACEVDGGKVVYAVPGVPYEMSEMVTRARAARPARAVGRARGDRVALAEDVGHVGVRARGDDRRPRRRSRRNPTIAFLARGIEGIYVRMTAKAPTEAEAQALLDAEEGELRKVLGELVFAVDDETMESAVLRVLRGARLDARRRRVAHRRLHRRADRERARREPQAFRGSIASYATEVKRTVLGVTAEQVVSRGGRAADGRGRAARARRRRRHRRSPASPGPTSRTASRSAPSGTASRCPDHETEAVDARLPFDRERIRQFSTISVLNLLRMRLASLP